MAHPTGRIIGTREPAHSNDVQLLVAPTGPADEAVVERIVRLGFEVRVELVLADGQPVAAQLPRTEAEELELREGDIVHVRTTRPASPAVAA